MENSSVIEFDLVPSCPEKPLCVSVVLDGAVFYTTDALTEQQHIKIEINDEQVGKHKLSVVLSGKLPEHTEVDDQGNIVSDSMISIKNLTIDEINCDELIWKVGTYTHDNNGQGETKADTLYSDLGCNGSADIFFSTPIYLWLLETL